MRGGFDRQGVIKEEGSAAGQRNLRVVGLPPLAQSAKPGSRCNQQLARPKEGILTLSLRELDWRSQIANGLQLQQEPYILRFDVIVRLAAIAENGLAGWLVGWLVGLQTA